MDRPCWNGRSSLVILSTYEEPSTNKAPYWPQRWRSCGVESDVYAGSFQRLAKRCDMLKMPSREQLTGGNSATLSTVRMMYNVEPLVAQGRNGNANPAKDTVFPSVITET